MRKHEDAAQSSDGQQRDQLTEHEELLRASTFRYGETEGSA